MKKILLIFILLLVVPLVYSTAECITKGGLTVLSQADYGVNEPLEIKVVLNLATGSSAGKLVTLYLKDKEVILQQQSQYTNDKGEAVFTFNALTKSGSFALYSVSEELSDTRTINIKPKLDLRLNVPTTNFINSPIKIDLRVTDAETGAVIIADKLQAIVMSGSSSLSYTISGTTLTIPKDQVISVGSINVEATAEKTGYISDIESAVIIVKEATTNTQFSIDGKDESSFLTEGIKAGNRKITIKVVEANQILEVGTFDIYVTNPSNERTKLNFYKTATGSYDATYNFLQEGNVYYVDGSLQVFGEGRQPMPVSFAITTIKKDVEELPFTLSWWVIAGVVMFVVMIIVLFVVFKRKK